jgi:putative membrane protein
MKISKAGLFLRGLAMGTADVIPGVSGGTIAFVAGVYEELITTLSGLGPAQVKALFHGDFARILRDLNLHFTLPLGLGILTALLSLAKIVPTLMREYPLGTFSFFFGLILCSAYVPYLKMRKTFPNFLVLILSLISSGSFFYLNPTFFFPQNYLGFFLSGAIAICAMILPGISGAYLLVLMGQYDHVLEALHTRNMPIVIVFSLGCLTGLLIFVRILKYLIHRYSDLTLAALTGLMLGSLVRIWPFSYSLPHENTRFFYVVAALLFGLAILLMYFLIRLDPENFKAQKTPKDQS